MNRTFEVKQTKFNNGEIDSSYHGDVSHPKFLSSLRTCMNWLPIQGGALVKWPGTKFVGRTKGDGFTRLIPFVFSDSLAFFLEVGVSYIRFWRNSKYVGTDYALYTWGALTPPLEIATPWTAAMLPYLKFAQYGDTITICYGGQVGGNVAPQDLTHTSGANGPWNLAASPTKIPAGVVTWNATTIQDGVGGFQATGATTGPIWNKGERAFQLDGAFVATEWTCIQDGTKGTNQKPPDPAVYNASFNGIQGNLFWTPSTDSSHQSLKSIYGITAVVQRDADGVVFESAMSPTITINAPLSQDRQRPIALINAPAIAAGYTLLKYKAYRAPSGSSVFGWLLDFTAATLATYPPTPSSVFTDDARAPDYTKQPPQGTDPFAVSGADYYPAVPGYFDQRRLFGGGALLPSGLALSRDGDLYNWDDKNVPGADTDSVRLLVISEVLEQIRGFASLARGVVLTGQGEFTLSGANGGALSRSSRSAIRQSKWGSSWLNPIVIGKGLLFNTAKSNQVRDLYPLYGLYNDNWDGQDLTVMARHLFNNYTLTDWSFQSIPYPVVRGVRSDGALVCMTYQHAPPSFGTVLTEGVVAWSRRVTGLGLDAYEATCVVPEPPEDAAYCVVRRTFGGNTYRFIEREVSPIPATVPSLYDPPTAPTFDNRLPLQPDARYGVFLDATLQFDGHVDPTVAGNAGVLNSVAAPGSANVADYVLGSQTTFAVASGPFLNTDPGAADIVLDPENVLGLGSVRLKVVGYTGAGLITCELQDSLTQAQLQAWVSASSAYWGIARSTFTVAHLSGYAKDSGLKNGSRGVWVLADGATVDPAGFTWLNGVLTLVQPAVVVCVGIAYNCDTELLDAYHPNAELRNKKKTLLRLGFEVANTRDLYLGPNFDKLSQWAQKTVAMGFGPPPLQTGYFEQTVEGLTNKDGRVSIRHFTPLPATLTSVYREYSLGDS